MAAAGNFLNSKTLIQFFGQLFILIIIIIIKMGKNDYY